MRRRSNTVSSGGESRPSAVWHDLPSSDGDTQHLHANTDAQYTFTSNKSVKLSRSRFGDALGGSSKHSVKEGKHKSVFFTNESHCPEPTVAPVAPKRHKKKSGGLKRPPNLAKVQKSDSSVSTKSSSSAKSNLSSGSSASATSSSSSSSVRQYFPFAQLHMDYGAPIMRDRELFKIQQSGLCGSRPLAGAPRAAAVPAEVDSLLNLSEEQQFSSPADTACHKRHGRLLSEPSSANSAILTTSNQENVPPLLPENEKPNSTNLIDFWSVHL